MPVSDTVRRAVEQMSVAQKVGQMIMVDFSGYVLTPALGDYIAENQWGGVILFAKNIKSRAQVAELTADLQQSARQGGVPAPFFVSIDQEGGIVNRLAFPECPSSPGNMTIGASGNDEYAYQTALIYAQELGSLGINLNFAPCVDVNNNAFNPIIGVRSFGESPQECARLGRAAARGYRDGGVIPTAKHFPGHGDTAVDSHLDMPTLSHPLERLEQVELVPFRALIEDGLEVMMTAHITYPALEETPGLPATLSRKILTGLLREKLGFNGVIVTDSMSMQAIARTFGVGQAAVMAVLAGSDIVLACGSREAQLETGEALLDAVRRGAITEERLDESVSRILALKERFLSRPAPKGPDPEAKDYMRGVARAGITLVKDEARMVPLKHQKVLLVAPTRLPTSMLGELDVTLPLADFLRQRGFSVEERSFSLQDSKVDMEPFAQAAADCDAIIACLHARDRLSVTQMELAYTLSSAEKPLAIIAVNSPYILMDIPWAQTYLCTYGYGRSTMEALADVFKGRGAPGGRLPISIPGLYSAGWRANA